jgi:hypothetical protein
MVTANNYMFRPLTGHHQVVQPIKMGKGLTIYKMYIVLPPKPFSLDVQPDVGLLEAETCSC